MLTFDLLLSLTGGTALQFFREYPVQHLLTDSRKVSHPVPSLFFAIRGDWNNGHHYVPELYRQGVRQFIIESTADIPGEHPDSMLEEALPEANVVLVDSSLRALQQVAAWHRSRFELPVIGITGSNGKTIVKEWLAQLFSPDERVVKSPRSFNSQIGVPLSVWQLNEWHTLGIFEAGISRPGEMEHLERVIQPTLGIFTTIGTAHDEGFTDRKQKIEEKLKLFAGVEKLFYPRDYEELHAVVQEQNLPAFTWSRQHPADLQITHTRQDRKHTVLTARYQSQEVEVALPFLDDASVENATHCLALLLYRGVPEAEIQERLQKLHPVAMRLEMKEAINGCYVIDDSYNNDFAGLTTALELLSHQPRQNKKTVILSDLQETGLPDEVLYAEVGKAIAARGINRFIGIGEHIGRHQHLFPAGSDFYGSTDSFLSRLRPDDFHNEVVLVKGARVFAFEKIVQAFQQKVHGTVLEVNLDALVHNLNYYRSRLQPDTKVMVMVKAFAYGSGGYEIANLLQFHRVDYLAVAYADEGAALREQGISLPVMVMNPSPGSFRKMQQYRLEPEIYSLELLEAFLAALPPDAPQQFIHLKLDTGMHRLGFEEADLESAITLVAQVPQVRVVSVFSHLAGADEALHNDFSRSQISRFKEMVVRVERGLRYPVLKHILNSAGIVRFPEEQQDMVRLGIGLYGVEASGTDPQALRPVGTLKTTVSQVKQVRKGDTVGYSRRGIAREDKQIATIAIGYADGYYRRFSNGVGKVLVNGQMAPIIGYVCMDMCMVDVTGLDVQAGDEVIVFGDKLNIAELAKQIGTIPYELLTNVSARVKRVFFAE
jgi:Alr-MurF fusion protein